MVRASFWTARLTAVKVIGKYLWLFVWPVSLSADYSYNAVPLFGWRPSNWEDAKALVALAVCLCAGFLAVLLAVRWRRAGGPALFFLLFFFVALLPTSNLVVFIGSIMAERFLYLPTVGLAGCTVAAILALGRHLPKRPSAMPIAWTALALVCFAFTARTYARNADWRDDRSLWTSAVEVCPEAARPHYNLALEFERIPGGQSDAIAEYQAALRIDPAFAEAHNNLANALARIPSRLPEAVAEYRAALALRPNRAVEHFNLAITLSRMDGHLPEAIAEYREALRLRPDYPGAHNALANALAQLPGHMPDALAEYRAALAAEPDRAEFHYNLANALAGIPAQRPEAVAEYQAALRLDPDFFEAHFNLANTLARTPERLPDAIAEYEAALRIRPDPQLRQTVDRLRAWLRESARSH
jgi:tetratricopeptide (TPR) repeat protein